MLLALKLIYIFNNFVALFKKMKFGTYIYNLRAQNFKKKRPLPSELVVVDYKFYLFVNCFFGVRIYFYIKHVVICYT